MDLLPRLRDATKVVMNPDKQIADILQHLLLSFENSILLGFAEKIDDERLYVSSVVGDQGSQLKGLEFFVGEGYLGHVVATAQPGYWTNVSKDPRVALFARNGIHPTSVFCYPVFRRQEVAGVLFGAFSTDAKKDALTFLELISIMLGRQMQLDSLEENLQIQTVRLAVLTELIQAFRAVEDVKNILYITLDMSLNLVQGPFCCIAFQPSNPESPVELITRGIPRQKAAGYGRELVSSYMGRTTPDFEHQTIPVIRTVETAVVIECPVFVQHKVIAVLAVAVDDEKELDEFTQLVYVLSAIAGPALQRIYTENTDGWIREISLIHKVSAFWSKESHQHASEIQELAEAFTKNLGWCEAAIRDIGQAALLTPFHMGFVQEILPDIPDHVRQALCEYRTILESLLTDSRGLSEAGLILAIVDYQLRGIDIHEDFIDIKLREKFEQFLLHRRIESQQIPLNDAQRSAQMDVLSLSELPIVEQLTVREQGVLQLLVTGKGNKEIAQTLFISEHTVKNHMTNIFQKLGVTDRTQAIAFVLGQLH